MARVPAGLRQRFPIKIPCSRERRSKLHRALNCHTLFNVDVKSSDRSSPRVEVHSQSSLSEVPVTLVLLISVNCRFALRRQTSFRPQPSSSETRDADLHPRVRRRVHRASCPRRCRRRRREKHQEPRRATTLSDRLTNPSPLSINWPWRGWRGWRRRDLPSSLLDPFVDSDSLPTTLVSTILRKRIIRTRFTTFIQARVRVAACGRRGLPVARLHAESHRRRVESDVLGLQNSLVLKAKPALLTKT